MAATYEPIATTTLSAKANSLTFSSIPSTYTDLVIVAQWSYIDGGAGQDQLFYRFNGDSGTNYSATGLFGTGSTAGSARFSNFTSFAVHNGTGASSVDGIFIHKSHIQSYANTNVYKTAITETAASQFRVYRNAQLWRSTSAISSITFFLTYNIAAGSTFSLFGLKAA